jgi:hypothetical protein
MRGKYPAMTIAKWFVAWAEAGDADADLSNLKLQKLLYYAQGHYLARTGTPLFPETIEAGPTVPLYLRYTEPPRTSAPRIPGSWTATRSNGIRSIRRPRISLFLCGTPMVSLRHGGSAT